MDRIIVSLDVETPNRSNDRICAIGLTVLTGDRIETNFYSLVNPEVEFDPMFINIHGIKPEDVVNAPTFPQIWDKIERVMRSGLIVAHNAIFDLSVLRKTLLAYNLKGPTVNYACTLKMARALVDGLDNYKLSTLAKYIGFHLHHHNACSDSQCCAELVKRFLGQGVHLDRYIRSFDLSGNRTSEFSEARYIKSAN